MKISEHEKSLMDNARRGTISIALPRGESREVNAVIVSEVFAVHAEYCEDSDQTFAVTHLPTGYRIAGNFLCPTSALLGAVRALMDLDSETIETLRGLTVEKATKNAVLKRIFKYISKWARVQNNRELEKQVGVFYRDREDCEKLRWAIAPKAEKILRDDAALGSEGLAGKLILGMVKLS